MDNSENKYQWPKIGNEKAITFLSQVLESKKVAPTYIFTGPENLGKSTTALAFARNLQGGGSSNSDIHILNREVEEKSIPIKKVREFIKTLSLGSFSGTYKVGIIKEASYLSEESKSALLKTLEEPKKGVVIIVLVNDLDDLPATIVSRAQLVYFHPVSSDLIYDYLINNYKASRSLAKDLANISLGRPVEAISYLENPEKYQEYLAKADLCLDLLLAEKGASRLEILNELFKDRSWSREARESAKSLIFILESLVRDTMLLSLDQPNLMQHLALSEKLTLLKNNFAASDKVVVKSLSCLKALAQARKYLNSSVNPRLVLEQVLISC